MDDNVVAQFTEITGSTPELATQYLQLTDFNIEQAMQLFFENGGAPLTDEPAPQPSRRSGYEDESGVVHIDSDTDDDHDRATHIQPGADATYEDDAAMARRLQEEAYGGGGSGGGGGGLNHNIDDDDVRAPMARTTETLVGPEADFDDDMHANILGQLRARRSGGRSYAISRYATDT